MFLSFSKSVSSPPIARIQRKTPITTPNTITTITASARTFTTAIPNVLNSITQLCTVSRVRLTWGWVRLVRLNVRCHDWRAWALPPRSRRRDDSVQWDRCKIIFVWPLILRHIFSWVEMRGEALFRCGREELWPRLLTTLQAIVCMTCQLRYMFLVCCIVSMQRCYAARTLHTSMHRLLSEKILLQKCNHKNVSLSKCPIAIPPLQPVKSGNYSIVIVTGKDDSV